MNYLALKGEASESIRRIYFAGYRKARTEPSNIYCCINISIDGDAAGIAIVNSIS